MACNCKKGGSSGQTKTIVKKVTTSDTANNNGKVIRRSVR